MKKIMSLVLCSLVSVIVYASPAKGLLKKVEHGNLSALNQAFLLHAKTDAGDAEDIAISIGKSITHHPKNFLTALKKNRTEVPRLDSVLGNLGPEFVDKMKQRKLELEKRLKAIHSVKDSSLKSERDECEAELKQLIEHTPAE
jgi:hypothetical protein